MEKNDSILSPDALPILNSIPSLIMVAGVGGAGGNAVNHMHRMGINGVNMAVFNTDAQALAKSPVGRRILLGKDGLGAATSPRTEPARPRRAATTSARRSGPWEPRCCSSRPAWEEAPGPVQRPS